ncbi:MAG: response regulator, partial [Pseudomonadota bacterium]
AEDAAAARKLFTTLTFDLAVLDIMMPGEDGLSLLKSLREAGDTTPVLLLTARGQATDRIEGLRLGADDYLPKPFEPEELALRAAAILKRTQRSEPPEEVEMSGLVFDPVRGLLNGPDGHVRLTEGELQLLTLLSQRPGEPFSREDLAAQTSNGSERSVDVQVTRLRKKIEPDPRNPIHIQTVRGIGYRLMPD